MRSLALICAGLVAGAALAPRQVAAQAYDGIGHPEVNGHRVFSAWNFAAGAGIEDNGTVHPEDSPNLAGWDYRINFPYTQLRAVGRRMPAGPTLVGVVEDTSATADLTQTRYQHVNNAVWQLGIDDTGALLFELLPARRSYTTNATTNISSLFGEWKQAAPPGSFASDTAPTALVTGAGINNARVNVVARSGTGALQFSSRLVDSETISSWNSSFSLVTQDASGRAAMAPTADGQVLVAWSSAAGDRIFGRVINPATSAMGPVTLLFDGDGNAHAPQLIFDGNALHLFCITGFGGLAHLRASSGLSFAFAGSLGFLLETCHVLPFDQRFHVACSMPSAGTHMVWYSTSLTPFSAEQSTWEPVVDTGLDDHTMPHLGASGDGLFVFGINSDGRIDYARKNAVVTPSEISGGHASDKFIEVGSVLDQRPSSGFTPSVNLETLSFNYDVYLTAGRTGTAHAVLINASRAALKSFMTRRFRTRLMHGGADTRAYLSAGDPLRDNSGGTFFYTDVDGDGDDDLVRVDGTTLRLSKMTPPEFQASSSQTIASGMHVLMGDVNGDGKSDLVTVSPPQNLQLKWTIVVSTSNGSVFTPVSTQQVSLSSNSTAAPALGDVDGDGRAELVLAGRGPANSSVEVLRASSANAFFSAGIWHSGFARSGWDIVLADVDGDHDQDLVGIVRQPFSDGGVNFGNAPVFVAKSTGSSFGARTAFMSDYAHAGEGIAVGDFNFDGKDDLVRAINGTSAGLNAKTVYAAFSTGNSFSPQVVVHSSFAGSGDRVLIGSLTGRTKQAATGLASDASIVMPDLVAVNTTNKRIFGADTGGSIPLPVGAPFENYRFFPEKALGVAMYPDRFWDVCHRDGHSTHLIGASGSGAADFINASVRPGARQGHMLQEAGHSIFAACIDFNDLLFDHSEIYEQSLSTGGFNANAMDGCDPVTGSPQPGAPSFLDCRDPQHYFLSYNTEYRANGERVRGAFAPTGLGAQIQLRYQWLKNNFYDGVEFWNDFTHADAAVERPGAQCLPGLCSNMP